MRIVIAGAGAIGGGLGALLAAAGGDVVLLARGEHAARMRADGLRVRRPHGDRVHRLPVVTDPAQIGWEPGDVCLLAVKTQDADALLTRLAVTAPADLPVVCATNGLACERLAADRFARVYGAMVYVPASHLVPGEVCLWSRAAPGIVDVGRIPGGIDGVVTQLVAALRAGGVDARADGAILDLKRAKLLASTANAVQALCGGHADAGALAEAARAEAEVCYRAAGLDPDALWARFAARVANFPPLGAIAGRERAGGSTWQSLVRSRGGTEAPWLGGEIVAMGIRHGVPTPLNATLVRLVEAAARRGNPPGSLSPAAVRAAAS